MSEFWTRTVIGQAIEKAVEERENAAFQRGVERGKFEQRAEFVAERNALRAELAAAKSLLARIHRDGGNHTEAVGFAQSVADADAKVSEWLLAAMEGEKNGEENDRQT